MTEDYEDTTNLIRPIGIEDYNLLTEDYIKATFADNL